MRWILVIALAAAALPAPRARAADSLGIALVKSCGKGVAVFEGRIGPVSGAAKAQMRFTLQARTPDEPEWAPVAAPGWGSWITAPRGRRYVYDRRVENLLAPGDYRAAIEFRWRDAHGRMLRRERAISHACRQPDPRPDLAISSLHAGQRYSALIVNTGRGAAGAFTVAFSRNGGALGAVAVSGLAAGAHTTAVLSGVAPCSAGDEITAVVDSGDAVDEVDEDANVLSVTCS